MSGLWTALHAGNVGALHTYVQAAGPFGPPIVVALMVLHTVLPFPAEVVPLVAGAAYGPWAALALTWTGAMIGGYLGFILARRLGRGFVRRRMGTRALEISARWTHTNAAASLLVLRLLPFVSFNLINYAAGLSEVDVPTFLWTMAIGILPLDALLSLLGSEATRGFGHLLWALAALVALLAAARWARRRWVP